MVCLTVGLIRCGGEADIRLHRLVGMQGTGVKLLVNSAQVWIGPDWLGRWYQRNIRMMGNVMQIANNDDRILIIVGDNHKWTLDMLFENAPDFKVVSSSDYLKTKEITTK